MIFVAEDFEKEKIVGYVIGKLDEEKLDSKIGHVTSLAVVREYRGEGLGKKLMD